MTSRSQQGKSRLSEMQNPLDGFSFFLKNLKCIMKMRLGHTTFCHPEKRSDEGSRRDSSPTAQNDNYVKNMDKELEKAILKTLCYADVFDYPLTSFEVWKFLIAKKSFTREEIKRVLRGLTRIGTPVAEQSSLRGAARINADGRFYFLKGRKDLVRLRKKRERYSEEKLKKAKRITKFLKIIPWIKMIGVTGTLAMKNSKEEGDIDLLIITLDKKLWLTRGLVVSSLRLFGQYRRPRKIKDRICPNVFLSEGNLTLLKSEQNLYTAHEVAQVKCLWDRDNTYQKFVRENLWVKSFLPNTGEDIRIQGYKDIGSKRQKLFRILELFEDVAYKAQLKYMEPKRTTELVTPTTIRFHPQNAKNWVLAEYEKRLRLKR